MTVVAIAGGLGDVGRTIAEEMLRHPHLTVHILSRKSQPGAKAREVPTGLPRPVEIDYSVVSAISKTLKQLQVDTVISTLNLHWPGASESQINLIRGAATSGVVSGFLPSEFNIDYNASEEDMPYPPRGEFLRAREELDRHPNLTYSLIRNGYFMDYLGIPFVESCLHPLYNILDLAACKAVIPGDGDVPVVWTHTKDVAKFVTALVDMPTDQWPREAAIVGERITLNSLVDLAAQVTGTLFEIVHDSVVSVKHKRITELPSKGLCYAYFPRGKEDLDEIISTQMVGMAAGVFDIKGVELHTMFSSLQRIKLRPFLQEAWAKKSNNR